MKIELRLGVEPLEVDIEHIEVLVVTAVIAPRRIALDELVAGVLLPLTHLCPLVRWRCRRDSLRCQSDLFDAGNFQTILRPTKILSQPLAQSFYSSSLAHFLSNLSSEQFPLPLHF